MTLRGLVLLAAANGILACERRTLMQQKVVTVNCVGEDLESDPVTSSPWNPNTPCGYLEVSGEEGVCDVEAFGAKRADAYVICLRAKYKQCKVTWKQYACDDCKCPTKACPRYSTEVTSSNKGFTAFDCIGRKAKCQCNSDKRHCIGKAPATERDINTRCRNFKPCAYCGFDTKRCPDGRVLRRNPRYGCNFDGFCGGPITIPPRPF